MTSSCAASAAPFAAAAPKLATATLLAAQDADTMTNAGESSCVAAPCYCQGKTDPVERPTRFVAAVAAIFAAGREDKVQVVNREDGREKDVMGRWVRYGARWSP